MRGGTERTLVLRSRHNSQADPTCVRFCRWYISTVGIEALGFPAGSNGRGGGIFGVEVPLSSEILQENKEDVKEDIK